VLEHFTCLDDAVRYMIRIVLDCGDRVAPREIATTEVRAMHFSIEDPRRRYVSFAPRRWSFRYALGEFCWHLRGSDRLDEIAFYAARWREMSEDGETINNSDYGAKIFRDRQGTSSQWDTVKNILTEDSASRRAVLYFADAFQNARVIAQNVSCAISLQFISRNGKLDAIASMRSNDVMLGLPYDVFLFTMLQEMMAVELKLELGVYHHFAGSLHLYDYHLETAEAIASSVAQVSEPMPKMLDLRGIPNLLNAEIESRTQIKSGQAKAEESSYWSGLASVIRYANRARFGIESDISQQVEDSTLRRLASLRFK
jgi:thymidylate synthase